MVDRESRDRMAESPVIHHTLRMSQAELASMLAAELINPLYCPETRRSQSVVKSEYVALLDGWFDAGYSRETYPKNSRGSLARICSPAVEFFVNIPRLDGLVRQQERNRELAASLREVETAGGLSAIRDVYRDALKLAGKKDYAVEWNHVSTRTRYSDLELTNIGYTECNIHLAGLVGAFLLQQQEGGETVILEAGVGTGGTTVPMVRKILELEREGLLSEKCMAGLRLLLYDTDERKTSYLRSRLPADLGFPGEKIFCAHGEFDRLEKVLEEHRGKIGCFISGASVCHVNDKRDFFRQVYAVLHHNGSLCLWDPLEPLLFAPRMRATEDPAAYYTRHVSAMSVDGGARKFLLKRREPFPEEALECLKKGGDMEVLGEIPVEDALRFCGTTGFEYLPQLGFTAELIGREQAARLCADAYDFLMEGIFSTSGTGFFDFIEWMQERCKDLPADEGNRSPYQLIEALEDSEAYRSSLEEAGFREIQCAYLSPALDYRKTGDTATASASAIGYVEAKKS